MAVELEILVLPKLEEEKEPPTFFERRIGILKSPLIDKNGGGIAPS